MSTQTPPTPKGPRNGRRPQKKNSTPSQTKPVPLRTPPASPPQTSSPGIVAVDYRNDVNGAASKKKNNGRSAKKQRDFSKLSNSPAPNRVNGHRHTSSQPSVVSPSQLKDSPHYAGPTFHASPAPSALPMPSFFSKSVPDSDLAPPLELDDDSPELDHVTESTPSKPKPRNLCSDEGRESSPLDFLFKAAVEARERSQRSPEAYKGQSSPHNSYSKAYPAQRTPDASSGGIFPLELDGSDSQSMPIGPSFATPYRERMNALRSGDSSSQSSADLDEAQRRAKTQALKNLLLNPRPQRPASASPFVRAQPNAPNGQANLSPNTHGGPLRTTSGPPTPVSFSNYDPSKTNTRYGSPNGVQYQYIPPLSSSAQKPRASSSALRREVTPPRTADPVILPSGASPSPATSNKAGYFNNRGSPYAYGYGSPTAPRVVSSRDAPSNPSANGSAKADTKRMEDDLRRILKLDMTNGLHSNEVQSSLA
ncbi:hypothetical protein Plec18167_000310 [Paecilomyces lecythidis]|uniref:Proteophosphoglycan 5 n=1 Tax=Paecilomyces lecythidis TaxID=3004212 RepID=A0ABR3YEI6_9EURO